MKMQQWRRSVKLARSTRDKLKVELKATKAALKSAQDAHRNTLESLQMEKQISEGYKRTIDQMRLFKERNTGPIA
jgi:hypothetical protein